MFLLKARSWRYGKDSCRFSLSCTHASALLIPVRVKRHHLSVSISLSFFNVRLFLFVCLFVKGFLFLIPIIFPYPPLVTAVKVSYLKFLALKLNLSALEQLVVGDLDLRI
jgi:hypothetical protein